jgi:thiamine-monophosphate kinase
VSKELAIIDLIAKQTGQSLPLADDAYWDADHHRIYTTDMLVEGRHFDSHYFSPQDIGWKAAAVNISDIAAMGGRLQYLLISLGLPQTIELPWIEAFYTGLGEACQKFDGQIVGGDTVSSDQLVINVTAIGFCPEGHAVGHRYQAQDGDYIIATGYHGLSHIGLRILQAQKSGYETCKSTHLRPMPRIEAGLLLSRRFTRYALMDSSDGLADALLKLGRASGKTLAVNEAAIPIHPELRRYQAEQAWDDTQLRQAILYGGEDFELVGTVPFVDDEILKTFHVLGRVEAYDGIASAYLVTDDPHYPRQALNEMNAYQHFEPPPEQPVETPHS